MSTQPTSEPKADLKSNLSPNDDTKLPKKKKKTKKPEEPPPAKLVKPPRITFNCFHTQYQIIKDVARKEFGWRVSHKDPWAQGVEWDIAWTDLAPALDRFPKVKSYQKINHFPGMFQIARKNYLARNLQKMKKQFPKDYKFFPKTWLLPYERNELTNKMQQYQKKGVKVNFIVKPECLSQGKGIFITKRIDQIDATEHLVVQKYMRQPYLIDGYKFDLRIYVLVTNVQPLRIFMHREGLGRFASEKYKLKAFNNPFIHLTNYAINKDNANFTSDEAGEKGHKRSLLAVYNQLEQDGVDILKLKQEIKDIIVKTLISIQPDLVHNYRTSQPGDIFNNMCFEILGFDVIIDKKGRPLLLEVNHAPSFNDDTNLDKQVKRNLLVDTFRLLNVSLKEKQQVLDTLKEINEARMIGVQKGSKQLQSIQRQDLYIEKLAQRDIYENENLYGYEKLYPPITSEKQVDNKQMDYYKIFQDHAKKFMMDFKVANAATADEKPSAIKRTKTEDRNQSKKQSMTVQDYVPRLTVVQKRNNQQLISSDQRIQEFPKRDQPYSIQDRQNQSIERLEDNPQSAMFQKDTNQSFDSRQISSQQHPALDTINMVDQTSIGNAQRTQQYQHAIIDQLKQIDNKVSRSISPQINIKHNRTIALPSEQASHQQVSSYSPNSSQNNLFDQRSRHLNQIYERQNVYMNKIPYQTNSGKEDGMLHGNSDDNRYQIKRDSSQTLLPSLSKSQIATSVRAGPFLGCQGDNINIQGKGVVPLESDTTKHSHRTSGGSNNQGITMKQQIMQYQFPILENKSQLKEAKGQRNHFAQGNSSIDAQSSSSQNNPQKYFSPTKHTSKGEQSPIQERNQNSANLNKRQKSQLQIGYKMAYYQQLANQQQVNISFKQLAFQPQVQGSNNKDLMIQGQKTQQKSAKKTLNQLLSEQTEINTMQKKRESANVNQSDIFQRLHQTNNQPQSFGNLNQVMQKLEKRGNNVVNRLLPQLDKLIIEQQVHSGQKGSSNRTFAYVKVNNLNK